MTDPLPPSLSPQDALVALLVGIMVADADIRTAEMVTIETLVAQLPVFAGYDIDRIKDIARAVYELFEEEDGLDALFGLVRDAMPERLAETAYALACDVAASDGELTQSELRFLEEMRHELSVDRLHAAAIERGVRARYARA